MRVSRSDNEVDGVVRILRAMNLAMGAEYLRHSNAFRIFDSLVCLTAVSLRLLIDHAVSDVTSS